MPELQRFRNFARLRQEAVKQADADSDEREKTNPKASIEELSMGAYAELLEPQVRDAVLALRRKGYPTFESGFAALDMQNVGLENDVVELKDFVVPPELQAVFASQGAVLEIAPQAVSFKLSRPLPLAEMKRLWDALASALPDLKRPAPPMSLPVAEGFREKQARLKMG